MLLKKSSDVYSQMNHNAIREIRYSPILGALQYYPKLMLHGHCYEAVTSVQQLNRLIM